MFRLPHNRRSRIQFALVLAFLVAFLLGALYAAEWLRSDEYYLEFERAIRLGDVDEVRRLLESGVSPNVRSTVTGKVPLHLAVYNDQYDIVELLLEHGANPNKRTRDSLREAPLHLAIQHKTSCIDLLLDHGARVDIVDGLNATPLHQAADGGDMELVRRCLDLGAPLHAAMDYGHTPASLALNAGHEDVAEYLLYDVGNGDFSEENLDLLLLSAIMGKSCDFAARLLDAGADPNATFPDNGPSMRTPITAALYLRLSDCARTLIDRGASLDDRSWQFAIAPLLAVRRDERGAAFSELATMMRMLVEAGIDVNEVNDRGETALHDIASAGLVDAIGLLLDCGADVNAQTYAGATPLHYAALAGWSHAVQALLDVGADPTIRSNSDELPIDYAKRRLADPHPDPNDHEAELRDPEAVVDILERLEPVE